MPKDFDSALSDALDLAANAAHTPGPSAARNRGRKRTMHQRIAITTASLVLVAVGATVAFKAAPSHDGSTPAASTSPHVTASASANPSPPTIPTSAASPSAGSSASSLGLPEPSTSKPISTQSTAGDPHKVVPAAWLSVAQLPFESTFRWKPVVETSQGGPIGTQLTPTVFYVANNTSYQTLTMCADPTTLLARTIGAQHTDYNASAGTGNNQASEYLFYFADAVSAQKTFAWLQGQYRSACLLNGTGVQVTQRAGDGVTESAWLSLKGKSNLPDQPAYAREYFVVRGNVIAYVSVLSYTDTKLPTTYADSAQLSTIASQLCVYGGTCN